MNEIDNTVERTGQLPKMSEQEINECLQEIFKRERLDDLRGNPIMCLTIVQSMADMRKDKHPTVAAAMDGLCAAYTKADALRSMLADADSIRIPTDDNGHFTTINKFLGQGTLTKQWYGKWQIGANYEEVFYDTALEAYTAYAAIKPKDAEE